jgi:hypothetical protein
MFVCDALRKTFVLMQSNWSVKKARQFIEDPKPTHVILKCGDPTVFYNLYTLEEAQEHLKDQPDDAIAREVFHLDAAAATPAVDAYADYVAAPKRGVVLDDGQIIGFFHKESDRPISEPQKRGESAHTKSALRSLVADLPAEVRLGDTISMKVSLSPGEISGVPLGTLAPGSAVDVMVQPKRGFIIIGPSEGSLSVPNDSKIPSLVFSLKATDVGPGRVLVFAFHKGQQLGLLPLGATVTASAPSSTARHTRGKSLRSLGVSAPDLTLLIMEARVDSQPAIKFMLSAIDPSLNLNFTGYGPIMLKLDPTQYFMDFFQDIEDMPLETATDRDKAKKHLNAKGAHLFRTIIPNDLQEMLWSLRSKIKYVHIQSQEPWIPWELCKLLGRENGKIVEGAFLCEQFAVTRWLMGSPRKVSLKLRNVGLVVPSDSNLPAAEAEKKYVISLAGKGRVIKEINASAGILTKAFATGEYDAWHFTGHGRFESKDPNRSAIMLEHGDALIPEDLSGEPENLGLKEPLIFLNACQVGQSGMSLTGIGGWAAKFLSCGAAAFIGAHWSVYDKEAHIFAKAFYDQLLSGKTIAEAVQLARTKTEYPTGLAYTVFADPLAKIES